MLPKITAAEVISALMFLAHVSYTIAFFPLICFKLLSLDTTQLFYLACLMGSIAVVCWFFLFRKVLNIVYARKIFNTM